MVRRGTLDGRGDPGGFSTGTAGTHSRHCPDCGCEVGRLEVVEGRTVILPCGHAAAGIIYMEKVDA